MTDKYCVIGNPIAHSRSPEIHAVFAAQAGQDMSYERCLAPVDGFADTVKRLVAEGYKGANVTVPFKLDADNTDGAGLVADIVRNAGVPLAGKRVLMLGAGGAARGAMLPILNEGPRALVLANRTRATADALAAQFAGLARPGQLAVVDFDEIDAPFDVVINATSASLSATMPPIAAAAFCTGTLAFDMMYAKNPTVFMEFAQAHGATTRDGLGMLVEQAAEAFAIWRGVRPETEQLLKDMRSKL
jgi:shikimate dehydrogenase